MPESTDTFPTPDPSPVENVRAAVLWARAAGIPVIPGARGVVCVSQLAAERWGRDPDARSVCPIGALLLHRQPDETDVELAVAQAIEAPLPWAGSFEAGLCKEELEARWTQPHNVRLAIQGYEAGVRFRSEFIGLLRGA